MIYRLNDEFTKIEEKDGVMQNKSCHAMIEVVTTSGEPEKDTGISLKPREKLAFSVETGKSLYARCECLEFSGANLAVVNFKKPASETGAGGDMVGDIKLRHILQPGYIKADGSLLNRAEYSALFAFAQENELLLTEADWANGMQGMYAEGDGEDTFRVPDLRGQFLRCTDDGAGVDADRVVGSQQEDAIRNITGEHTAYHYGTGGADGVFSCNTLKESCLSNGTIKNYNYSLFKVDASLVVPTAEENRPKNIALIAQIKY